MSNSRSWYLIVNPVAGGGAVKRQWAAIEKALLRHLPDFKAVFTESKGHAIALVEQGLREGYRRIMAVGGDGTSHEVINGLMLQEIVPLAEVQYTLLPVGTGNDWIKTHGIPADWRKWLPMIPDAILKWHEVGVVDYQFAGRECRRYFANVAGLAYDGYVVEKVESNKHRITNRFFYLWWIVKCLFNYHPIRGKVVFGEQTVEDNFYTVNAGICRFSGGGMQLTPHANPDDGLLALTIAGNVSKAEVILNIPRFYAGTLDRNPKIRIFQVPAFRVESCEEKPILLEADGEFLGHTPVSFGVIAKAFRVLTPGS